MRRRGPGESGLREVFSEEPEINSLEREYEQVDNKLFLALESKKETSDEIHWRQVQGEEVGDDLQGKWRRLNTEVGDLERRKQEILRALDEKARPDEGQDEPPLKSVVSFLGMARRGTWVPAGIVTALILITAWAVWYYSENPPLLPGKLTPRGAGRQAAGEPPRTDVPPEPVVAAPEPAEPEEFPGSRPEEQPPLPAETAAPRPEESPPPVETAAPRPEESPPPAETAVIKPEESPPPVETAVKKPAGKSGVPPADTPPPRSPYEIASSYRKKKNYERAEEVYREIIRSGPQPGRAYYELGEMYLEQGLFRKAKEMFGESERYYEENVAPE